MGTALSVAIVSSLGGLLAGVLAFVQALRVARMQVRTQERIEQMRVVGELRFKSILEAGAAL